MSVGKSISQILAEIEDVLWEFQAHGGLKPEFTEEGFKGAVKIFIDVMMDKMWELQEGEGISQEDRVKMGEKLGVDIRNLIKNYTDIDTHELYSDKTKKA